MLVERLEDRTLLEASLTPPVSPSPTIVDISASGDFELVLVDGARVIRAEDGTVIAAVPDGSDVTINGSPFDDTFTINASNGNPMPGLGATLTFTGGGGFDSMRFVGDGATTVLNLTLGDGTAAGDMDGQAFMASGLAPIDVTGMLTATLMLAGGADAVTIANGFNLTPMFGAPGTIPAIVASGTSGGPAFETTAFFGNTTVVIDTDATVAGSDAITILGAAGVASANMNLSINTGAGAGETIMLPGATTFPTGTVILRTSGTISGAGTVTAASARLSGLNVGSLAMPISTAVATLAGTSGSFATPGDFAVSNAGDLTIGTVDGVMGVTASAPFGMPMADVRILALTGSISQLVGAPIGAIGTATVTAGVNAHLEDVVGFGLIDIDATTGSITQGAGTTVFSFFGGIGLAAGINASVGTVDGLLPVTIAATAGFFSQAAGTTIQSRAGGVEITAGTTVTADIIEVAANTAKGGTAAIGITAPGTVTLNGTLDATGLAAAAVLIPGLHISVDPTDVNVNAPMLATGNITIEADNDILATAAGDLTSSGGSISLTADFDGSLAGTIDFDGDLSAALGSVTVSLADCDGFLNGLITATNLTKNGGGAIRVTATYTGGTTTINAGILLINGTIAAGSGDVDVNSGGTLGGTGTINAAVDVNAGGTLDPGDVSTTTCAGMPGFLTVNGNVDFFGAAVSGAGGTFRVQINGAVAGVSYDQLAVNGLLDLNAPPGAAFESNLSGSFGFAAPIGSEFFIIANDPAGVGDAVTNNGAAVSTTVDGFNALPELASVSLGGQIFNISYLADTAGGPAGNDVLLFLPGHFDFNGPANATAVGWLGVPEHLQHIVGTNIFGWRATDPLVPSFDRFLPNDLVRDGHFAGSDSPRTFEVEIVNGTYQVMLIVGDANFTHDRDRIRILDGAILRDTRIVTVPMGSFSVVLFPSILITSGQLNVELLGLIPSSDLCAVINALDIRSTNSVGPLTIAGASLPGPVDADGLTVDTYTGSGALPGAIVSITTTNGTVTSPDVDPNTDGVQVLANGTGMFSFTIRRPSSSASGTITALDITGAAVGNATQLYQVAALRRFDFNAGSSAAAAGFIGLPETQTYDATLGYGWGSAAAQSALHPISPASDLRQDFHLGRNRTFQFEAAAATAYNLQIYHVDGTFAHDNFTVSVEGGGTYTVVSLAINTPDIRTLTGMDANADGRIDVTFVDNGGSDPFWIVNGIDVATGALPAPFPLRVAGGAVSGGGASLLTSIPQRLGEEVFARWRAAGIDESHLDFLGNVTWRVADLGGELLGSTSVDPANREVVIDDDAAGYGWYVDPSPQDDIEFVMPVTPVAGVDLLTVMLHEFGHLIGFDDLEANSPSDQLMASTLPAGARRSPERLLTQFEAATGQLVVTLHQPAHFVLQARHGAVELSDNGRVVTGLGRVSADAVRSIVVLGSAGDDVIDASGLVRAAVPNLTRVTVHAGRGNDVVLAGDSDDLLNGGNGNDRLIGGAGNDTLLGAAGDDSLDGGSGNDVLRGQGSSDVMTGGSGDDELDGGSGTDVLVEHSDGVVTLTDNRLHGSDADRLSGVEQAHLSGGPTNDRIDASGFSGSASLNGNGGDDTLLGGSGPDHLRGGAGADRLEGGPGDDRLQGQGGSHDVLLGGLGNDLLDGGSGSDTLLELADVDFVLSDSRLTGAGSDVIRDVERAILIGGASANRIDASGFTGLTTLAGAEGNDVVTGGTAGDLLFGGDGNDVLLGFAGDDLVSGGAGTDFVNGQGGTDTVAGGSGTGSDWGDFVIGLVSEIDETFTTDFGRLFESLI